MATPMTADQLVAALRAEGVQYVEYRSWRTHNRNHKGRFGPVHGLYIHHTAGVSKSMADTCYDGYDTLPGPVCHGMLAKTARVYLVGNGRANHAGGIAQNAFDAVVDEESVHPRPDVAEPIDGNVHFYGLEIENRGDGKDPYPAAQYDQAVRWAAAHCRFHGWSADSVIGHREATRRKVDPTFSMTQFRADVAERLRHPASWSPGDTTTPPTKPEEPTMALTQAEYAKIALSVHAYKGKLPNGKPDPRDAYAYLRDTAGSVAALSTKLGAIAERIDQLQTHALTDAQIDALVNRMSGPLAERVLDLLATRVSD